MRPAIHFTLLLAALAVAACPSGPSGPKQEQARPAAEVRPAKVRPSSKCGPQAKCGGHEAKVPASGARLLGFVTDASGRAPASPFTVRAIRTQFRFDNFDGTPAPDVQAAPVALLTASTRRPR